MTGTRPWFLYLLRFGPGHLYTGISTDPQRRLREHEDGRAGARSLRGKGPLALVFATAVGDRSRASRLEAAVKKLPRRDKERLAAGLLSVDELLSVPGASGPAGV